jgi:phage-related protein
MAINLATAYVDIVSSTRGLGSDITRQFGGLQGEADKAGAESGKSFGGKFGALAKVGILGAGALIAGALGASIAAGVNMQAVTTKLGAQLGASGAESARLGQVAGSLYADNYGESLGDVANSVKSVIQNIGGMATASNSELSSITGQVSSLASTFEQDLGGTTAAVGQLMKTGLAANAQQALDIITVGFQHGVDKSGDFLDTLNEYGTQFRKLGIDGTTATGLLSQGLKGGARDADVVADSLKEFSIRAVDGSKTTAAGFKGLGLDVNKTAEAIGKGGKSAAAATQTVLTRMKAIKDPVQQAAIATELFGTQSEDLGKALFSLDLNTAATGLGKVAGAAKAVDSAVSNTISSKFTALGRSVKVAAAGIGSDLLPIVGPAVDGLTRLAAKATSGADYLSARLSPAFTTVGKSISGALTILTKGDFDPKKFAPGITEDSPFVNALFTIREGAEAIGKTVGGVFSSAWKTISPILMQVGSIIGPAIASAFRIIEPIFAQLGPIVAGLLPVFNPFSVIFRALLPILPQVAAVLGQIAKIIAGAVMQAFTAVKPLLVTVIGVIHQLLPIITTLIASLLPPLASLFAAVAPALKVLLGALQPVIATIASSLIPIINALMPVVKTVFAFIGTTITNVMKVVQNVILVVTGIIQGNWSQVWGAIKGIISTVWSQIKTTVSTAINVVKGTIGVVLASISGIFRSIWSAISSFLGQTWAGIKTAASAAFGLVKSYILTQLAAVKSWISGTFATVVGVFSSIWQRIKSAVSAAFGLVRSYILAPLSSAKSWVAGTFGAIVGTFATIWRNIKSGISTAFSTVEAAIRRPFQAAWDWVTGVFARIEGSFSSIWSGIVSTASSILGGIGSAVGGAFSGIADIVKAPINAVIGLVNGAISGLNSISVTIPSWVPLVGGKHFGVSIGYIPSLASGAVLEPTPGGTIVRVAEAGQREIVTPEPLMRSVILDALEQVGGRNTAPLIGTVNQLPGQSAWDLARDLDRQLMFVNGR